MRILSVFFSAVIFVGCSAGPVQVVTVTASSVSTASPEPSVNGWSNAQAFSEAAWKGRYSEAKRFAADGGPAARYLAHMEALQTALDAAGSGDSNTNPNSIDFDATNGTVTATYDDDTEVIWQEFQYDSSGLVFSWSTSDSNIQLSKRLWTKASSVSTKSAKVALVSAYKNDSGLWVILDVNAKERALAPDCSPTLTDTRKRQREASDCNAPDTIGKGTSAYIALLFKGAEFGGTLKYDVLSKDYDNLGTITMKIE